MLEEGVELAAERELTKLEKQGLIKAFEFTQELSWNVLKDFLQDRGHRDIYGSKDAVREAFKQNLIGNGEIWMGMIRDRNLSSHTYDETRADNIIDRIIGSYLTAFREMEVVFEELAE